MSETVSKDGIKYALNNKTAWVIDYTKNLPEYVVIPNEIQGLPVTRIDMWAFEHCASLKSIVIPDSVESIGNCAFEECISLANITISNSVLSIGDAVFCDCKSLENIVIPNSVTSIGDSVFWYCDNLKTIHLPKICSKFDDMLFCGMDIAPEVFFDGTKKDFKNIFKFDIFKDYIAKNKDKYIIPTTVHCVDGDLIC